MIDGVVVCELKTFADNRGKVMHMLRRDSSLFTTFGEIYFSIVNPGVVKAWKIHQKNTQHFAVPVGKIKLVLYDGREGSRSNRKIEVLEIGEDNYCLVKIPPLVSYGFQCLSSCPALVANLIDQPYCPDETRSLAPSDNSIPYSWQAGVC